MAGGGNDTVYGGPGNDSSPGAGLHGEEGDDTLYGQGGSDIINAESGDTPGDKDFVYGGGGIDDIYAVDANEDIIDCGKGTDRVFYDQFDTIKGCENRNLVEV